MPAVLWFRRDLRLSDLPPLLAAVKIDGDVLACYVLDPRLKNSSGPRRLAYLYDALRELHNASTEDCWSPAATRRTESPRWPKRSAHRRCTSRRTTRRSGGAATKPSERRSATSRWRRPGRHIWCRRAGSPRMTDPVQGVHAVLQCLGQARLAVAGRVRARSARWIDPADVPTGVVEIPDAGVQLELPAGEQAARRQWQQFTRPCRLRQRAQPPGPRRHQPDVSAPEVRHHPSAHPGRGPRDEARERRHTCGSSRSATSTPPCCTRGRTARGGIGIIVRPDRGRQGQRREAVVRGLEDRTHRFPDRRRRDAPAGRDRVDAQPGANDRGVVSGQGPAPAVAVGGPLVPRAVGGRRHGQQPARVAVGGRVRHRRRAVLPRVQPDHPGAKFDPSGDYVRRWVPELAGLDDEVDVHKLAGHRPAGYPEPIVDHAQERAEALRRYGALK